MCPDAAASISDGCSWDVRWFTGVFGSASSPAGVAKFNIDLEENAREVDR